MAAPKTNKTTSEPPTTVQNFLVVGIGASTSGLDATKGMLTAIPENSGMAYVLVQHLDPSHESILPEILQRVTIIPVLEITDDIPLAPDHIYIIPSNKILTSTDGVMKLIPREKKINLTIDVFFKSLADVHKEFAVGVVLSGTGSDGTLGLKAIKENGGISIAQDPETATYNNPSQNVVNSEVVDFILAPEKIPAHLLQISSSYKSNHFFKDEEEIPKEDDSIFKQILLLLQQLGGVDFTYYKQPNFHRRIARRITIVKKKNLTDYLKFLRIDKAEQDALFLDVLIPVTSFFRDPKTFQALTNTVFPSILKNKTEEEPIRIWIAGCSTGEEAFSIAICLHEYLSLTLSKREGRKIQIFASDISERAIKKARAAIYTKADVEKLSETQLNTYFVKNNDVYEVSKLIRDMCVFATHNFLKDPPFAKMDLISCHNVLIYMDTFLQKKAFITFHYALKESGFLLLGKSETTGASSDLFTQVSKQDKIYSRKPLPGRFMHVATERKEVAFTTTNFLGEQAGKTAIKHEIIHTDFRKSAEEIMISKSPASVVVNEVMEIVHVHGDITPFLQAPQGKPTHNLIKMAREELAFELRNAIHKASKDQATVTKENIPVKTNGDQSLISIEIIPLTDTVEPYYLIRFVKKIIPIVAEEKKAASGKTIETQKQNQQLEKELSQTREDMRSITEDMEATNEELQSANEELQSSNEEMQSLNEELETSKEEIQSTNEELLIVNQELLDKQEQLNTSYSQQVKARKQIEASEKRFSNILSQSFIAIAILKGPELIVTFANEPIIEIWGKGRDIFGKPMIEVLPEIKDQVFPKLLNDVYTTGVHFVNNEILCMLNRNGKMEACYFNLVYQPYRDSDDSITGIVILATEITQQVISKKQIEASEIRFRNLILQAPVLIITFQGPSFILETINKTALEMCGKTYDEVINKPLFEVLPEDKDRLQTIFSDIYTKGEPYIVNEHRVQFKRQGKLATAYFNLVYQPLRDLENKIYGIILIGTEVTEAVNARKLIEESEIFNRTILESSPDCIKVLDREGRIEYMNSSGMCQMEIDDFSTVKNKYWWTLWGSENEKMVKTSVKKAMKGETAHFIALFPNIKGTQKWWDVVISPVGKPGEQVQQIISVSRDITEQKKSEETLRKSKERLQVGIALTGIALIEIDYNTNMATLTPEAAQMYGLPSDVLIITRKQLHDTFHPECKLKMAKNIEELLKSESNGLMDIEHRILLPSGEMRWLKINNQVFFDPDSKPAKPLYSILASQDITAKKEIEEATEKLASHLKLATDSAKVGIWTFDIVSFKLEWSNIHKKMWGYDENRENLTYEDWYTVIFKEDKELAFQKIEESKVNHSIYDVDYRITRANDGAIVWIKSTGQFQYDEFGVAHTIAGISLDITEQKRFDQELLEAKSKAETDKEMAENAVMAKQQFLSNMSHEIRTPMNAIIGFTKVLMKTDLTKKQKDYLHAVKTSGSALIVLINDILDLAKVDAGKMIFVNAPFKISDTITTILRLFETKIKENNLELVMEYDTSIPEIVLGDSVRLHQILINLLSNAIKFTAKGKITIRAILLNQDEEKVVLEINISDTGIGIVEDKLINIFENFEQAYTVTSSLYGGTGLGLAIVKQLVEKQGGTISVKSKVDQGSTFSFTLPFQKNQANLECSEEEEMELELDNEIKDINVLVVEDVKLNQLLMTIFMDNFKFNYAIADNGKMAIEKLQTNTYDIILMDLQMPIMNGFEATEHIRNIMNLQIPIIALTADVTTVDLKKCKSVGMNDYISKPIDEKLLYRKILDLLKSK